jgi:hypothetical protein
LNVTIFGAQQFVKEVGYGPFTAEDLVGEALAPFRQQVVITTKFGFDCNSGKRGGLNSQPAPEKTEGGLENDLHTCCKGRKSRKSPMPVAVTNQMGNPSQNGTTFSENI